MRPAEVREALASLNRKMIRANNKLHRAKELHATTSVKLLNQYKRVVNKCDHKFSKTTCRCVGCGKTGAELAGVTI